MTIELITFDLDDTLWDTAPVIVSAETVLREWLIANAPKVGALDASAFQATPAGVERRAAIAPPDQCTAPAGVIPCPAGRRLH